MISFGFEHNFFVGAIFLPQLNESEGSWIMLGIDFGLNFA